MPIITKSGNPVKGSPTQFTLDKVSLSNLSSVSSNLYYSNTSNWNSVILFYISNPGNQRKFLKFDATQITPSYNFFASLKSRDIFQIYQIIIKDFDGGYFIVNRSELNTSEFDVDMTQPLSNITWNFLQNPNYSLNGQNQLISNYSTLNSSPSTILYSTNTYAIGNGIEYKLKVDNGFFPLATQFQFIGLIVENTSSYSGFYRDYAPNQLGVNNNLNILYNYPTDLEIEFKIVITTTNTLFYANNALLNTLGPISSNSLDRIYTCVRFNNQYNIKQFIITQL